MALVKVFFVLAIIIAAGAAILVIYISQNEPRMIDPKRWPLSLRRFCFAICHADAPGDGGLRRHFRMEKHLADIIQQGRR